MIATIKVLTVNAVALQKWRFTPKLPHSILLCLMHMWICFVRKPKRWVLLWEVWIQWQLLHLTRHTRPLMNSPSVWHATSNCCWRKNLILIKWLTRLQVLIILKTWLSLSLNRPGSSSCLSKKPVVSMLPWKREQFRLLWTKAIKRVIKRWHSVVKYCWAPTNSPTLMKKRVTRNRLRQNVVVAVAKNILARKMWLLWYPTVLPANSRLCVLRRKRPANVRKRSCWLSVIWQCVRHVHNTLATSWLVPVMKWLIIWASKRLRQE